MWAKQWPGLTVNAAFTPSANVLAPVNKTRGMLFFIKRSFTCLKNKIFIPLYSVLVRPHLEYAIQANCSYLKKDINQLESIQRAATRWVKGLRGVTYEERLQALKLQPLGKRMLRNDLVLPHKIRYNHIDLDVTQLFEKRYFNRYDVNAWSHNNRSPYNPWDNNN